MFRFQTADKGAVVYSLGLGHRTALLSPRCNGLAKLKICPLQDPLVEGVAAQQPHLSLLDPPPMPRHLQRQDRTGHQTHGHGPQRLTIDHVPHWPVAPSV